MKKIVVIISVLIIAVVCFAGCSTKEILNDAQLAALSEEVERLREKEEGYINQIEELRNYIDENEIYYTPDKEKPVEEPKKYVLMGIRNKTNVPTLTFYEEKREFSFLFDSFSDDILEGNFEIIDKTLTAQTYDGKFYFTFEIMDESSLVFIADKSSEITLTHSSVGYQVEDQTVFKLEE